MKKILIIIGTTLLFSCTNSVQNENLEKNLSKWPWFSITPNIAFEKTIERDDGSLALITYDNTQTHRDAKDFGVYVYPNDSSCPILNIRNETKISDGIWGEINFGNAHDGNGWTDYDQTAFCMGPGISLNRYAFCAEKDGKAVAICVQQMTDNEDQAREIFESFRWTN